MAVPKLVPRAPTSVTRADTVEKAVREAIDSYRSVLNTTVPFRSVQVDIKFQKDGHSVRAVVVTAQGEVHE